MIRLVRFYDGDILNMSGILASPAAVKSCKYLHRCTADKVRQLWDFSGLTIITPDECIERAERLVELAKRNEKCKAVWIRSMKSAPFFYAYVEDAFLSAGYRVCIPAEEYNGNSQSRYAFDQRGWWVIEPFAE